MLNKLKLLASKINQLSLRERVLVLLAVMVVIQQTWDSLVWQEFSQNEEQLQNKILDTTAQIAQSRAELLILSSRVKKDPDKALKNEINSYGVQLDAIRKNIDQLSGSLISPAEMSRLLSQLLSQESGLRLVSLQTIKSRPLIDRTAGPDDRNKAQARVSQYQIYRHDFVIEFQGDYLSTLKYIESLEQLSPTFFWRSIDYTVTDYPDARVRLLLYTLSLSEGWIGV